LIGLYQFIALCSNKIKSVPNSPHQISSNLSSQAKQKSGQKAPKATTSKAKQIGTQLSAQASSNLIQSQAEIGSKSNKSNNFQSKANRHPIIRIKSYPKPSRNRVKKQQKQQLPKQIKSAPNYPHKSAQI